MPHTNSKISPKSIGIIAALVVPMMLISTSGQARSDRYNNSFFDQPLKVKFGASEYNKKSDGQDLQRFFDGAAPRNNKALNKARNRRADRSRRGRSYGSRRYGNTDNYYDQDIAISCISPRQIHRRLHRQGWHKFHNLRIRSTVLTFKARQTRQGHQANDLTYNLRIDRCTGALIKAKLQFKDMWYIRWMRRISNLN